MPEYYLNNYSEINIYKKMSSSSEIVTQMIYGDGFSIINKKGNWLKIRIKDDGYIGYIKKKNFPFYIRPTHKVFKLFANVFRFPNKRKKVDMLTYGSKIRVKEKKSNFVKFDNKWIEKKNIKPINYLNKDVFSNLKIFKNIKYKWGGKSFRGLDCSALVQVFMNFNKRYCPRDAKDQVRYFKKNINKNNIKKNDIIFWKGHVAIALSKKKLIHAYGPMKKTVVMGIDQTIDRIKRTANLKVIGIKRL